MKIPDTSLKLLRLVLLRPPPSWIERPLPKKGVPASVDSECRFAISCELELIDQSSLVNITVGLQDDYGGVQFSSFETIDRA